MSRKRRPGPGRPFERGKSGNPGGRPKGLGVFRALARTHALDCLRLAAEFVADDLQDPRLRLDAARFLVAYGLGAPPKDCASISIDVKALGRVRSRNENAIKKYGGAWVARRALEALEDELNKQANERGEQ